MNHKQNLGEYPSLKHIMTKEGRLYPIAELDNRELPSVTNILNQRDKPALMHWASKVTAEYAQTEIMDKLKNGSLTIEDIQRMDTRQFVQDAKSAHKRISDEAKDIGKRAHEFAHQLFWFMKDNPGKPIEMEVDEDIMEPAGALVKWVKENEVKPIAMEERIYSTDFGGYAGTLDLVAIVNGRLLIIDAKTSKAIYPEYPLQAAAYEHAYSERNPGAIIDGTAILRLDKLDGYFEFAEYDPEETADYLEEFGLLCQIWHLGHNRNERQKEKNVEEKERVKELKKDIPKALKKKPKTTPF